ncbi:hypothetical protein YC2023_072241 [Brassica napus]
MEFQSFEEMLEYDVNVKEAIMSEEVNQVMQTVYFPTYSDRSKESKVMIVQVYKILDRLRHSRFGGASNDERVIKVSYETLPMDGISAHIVFDAGTTHRCSSRYWLPFRVMVCLRIPSPFLSTSIRALENDNHVFKWVDEAFTDEIQQLNYQVRMLEEEVQSLKATIRNEGDIREGPKKMPMTKISGGCVLLTIYRLPEFLDLWQTRIEPEVRKSTFGLKPYIIRTKIICMVLILAKVLLNYHI